MRPVLLLGALMAGSMPGVAVAAPGWTVLFSAPATQPVGAKGDGSHALAYVAGRQLRVLDSGGLHARSVPLPAAGCVPERMAAGAVLVGCGRSTGLVTPTSGYRPLANRDAAIDPDGGPADVIGLGTRWLAVYNAGPLLSQTFVSFVDWRSGAVVRDPAFPRDLRFDLDSKVPRNTSPCTDGFVLDQRGDRWLMHRRRASGGAVYLVDCGSRHASRLGVTRVVPGARGHRVTGQIGTSVATWTVDARVTAVQLKSRRAVSWSLRTAPLSRVSVGQAGDRLIASVVLPSGRRQIQTVRIPR